jgi:plasmid stabilization system protein ParE
VKVEYAETARRQIRNIAMDYARERRSLGADFVFSVDDAVSKLLENPRIGARLAGVQRRILLGRFPYLLVYEIDARNDRILVNCISHQRRHPDHWRGRVEDPAAAYEVSLAEG